MSAVAADEFRDVIGHFASGVTVITAEHGDRPFGTTASAVSSLSLEPPMLLACLNRTSSTREAIAAAGHFAVNILGQDQADAALRFGRKGADKFAGVAFARGAAGDPLLEGALATVECRVVEVVAGGTHSVFVAAVERAQAAAGMPLAYFRGRFGRLVLTADEPPPTLAAVEDGLRARRAIELGVVAGTVGRLSAPQLRTLRRAVRRTRPATPFDLDRHMVAYAGFHEDFVGLAGSPGLVDAHRRADAPALIVGLTRGRANGALARAARAGHGHCARLLAAYEAADPAAATAAIERHVVEALAFTRRYGDAAGP
jgi:flavin reductase (DIM6/NTAB) family NADH-FMN oxidoreductase RutF